MSMQQLKQCLPLDNVGLVKLDCEGCEFEVVPSNTAASFLRGNVAWSESFMRGT